jgi:hypothetical protein
MQSSELQKAAQLASRSRASDYFAKQIHSDDKSEKDNKSPHQRIFARPPLSEVFICFYVEIRALETYLSY